MLWYTLEETVPIRCMWIKPTLSRHSTTNTLCMSCYVYGGMIFGQADCVCSIFGVGTVWFSYNPSRMCRRTFTDTCIQSARCTDEAANQWAKKKFAWKLNCWWHRLTNTHTIQCKRCLVHIEPSHLKSRWVNGIHVQHCMTWVVLPICYRKQKKNRCLICSQSRRTRHSRMNAQAYTQPFISSMSMIIAYINIVFVIYPILYRILSSSCTFVRVVFIAHA